MCRRNEFCRSQRRVHVDERHKHIHLPFAVWGLPFTVAVYRLRFEVEGLGLGFSRPHVDERHQHIHRPFAVWGLPFTVLGFGFWGSEFGVWNLGSGVWVWGLGFHVNKRHIHISV